MKVNPISKNSLLSGLLMTTLGLMASLSSLAQVSVTATGGTAGPTPYTTLSDAFAAVNAGTHTGAVDIAITGNTTEPLSVTALLKSTSPSNYTSVLIHPTGGSWIINSNADPAPFRGVIELAGADNVTIDGDDLATPGGRNLTIQAATSTNNQISCVRLSSNSATGTDGANDNTIKNCILIGPRSSATNENVSYGINMSNYSTAVSNIGAYSSLNTVIDNNEITRSWYGIYANGESSSFPNTGTIIRNNTIGSETAENNIGGRGIYIDMSSNGTGTAIIQNNDIRAGAVTPTGASITSNIYGIELGNVNAGCLVDKNNIHDILQPDAAAYGINISSASADIKITNNFIRDIVGERFTATLGSSNGTYGIRISVQLSGLVISNNTIALLTPSVTGSTANSMSAAIVMSSSPTAIVEFRNNILINNNPSTKAFGFYFNNSTFGSAAVNNNDYYVPGGAVGYFNGSARTTLSLWQSATGKDQNSFNINPPFVSATDLHIIPSPSNPTVLESGGGSISNLKDIDGDDRPGPAGSVNGGGTAHDIGADEFDGKPVSANDMAATAFVAPADNSTIGTGTFTPQASFTNTGSAAQTNVPVRYQIIDATSAIIYDNAGTIPSLAAYTGTATFSFTPTALTAGTYTIKAIAELVGDAITSNDTITGSLNVMAPLCGTYHIGASQPAPYNTFTSAVNTLNNLGISCAVTFLLDDAAYNESDLIQFNQDINGVSAVNTVTVSPNAGASVSLNGNFAGTFIRVLSDYVTINGSNTPTGSSRNLTISNSNTAANSTAIVIGSSSSANPVTNVTVKNCIVINTLTNGNNGIVIGNETGSSGGYFNNITIQNNDVRKAVFGIWARGTTATDNGSGLLITENVMTSVMPDAIRRMGVRIEGVDGAIVSNNEIANIESTTATDHKRAIYLGAGTMNIIVKGNTIHDLEFTSTGSGGSVQGIGTLPSTGVVNPANITIDSNFISNIRSSSSKTGLQDQTYGITVFADAIGYTITRNRITNIENDNATGFGAYGINLQSSGDSSNIIVANNFISNIKSQGAAALENNAHGIFINAGSGYKIYHNSINMTTTAQSGTEVSAAIALGPDVSVNGPVMDIRNNIFSNSNTAGAPYAIYSAVSSANNAGVYLNLDYNDYYSAGANLAFFSGADQTDLAALQSAFSGANVASQSVLPVFVSASDLHLLNAGDNSLLINMGTPSSIGGINGDIDQEMRPFETATDIGADEFNSVPLSVKLKNLVAVNIGSRNRVDWESASEKDANSYVVEKSTDGKTFAYLGTATAKGHAAAYNYWDENPVAGVNYYRLKMYGADGTFSYSKTVQATFTNNNTASVSVYPNPATSGLIVETKSNTTFGIYDLQGKVIMKGNLQSGKNTLNVSGLAKGFYTIKIGDYNQKIVLQ